MKQKSRFGFTAFSGIRLVLFFLAAFVLGAAAVSEEPLDLTGKWKCDAGGTYYIRHAGSEIYWLGQSDDDGAAWSHIFLGTLKGRTLTGKWADVPKGGAMGAGRLTLKIESPKSIKVTQQTGDFLTTQLEKQD